MANFNFQLSPVSMRERVRDEWVRLNPKLVGSQDTWGQVLLHAAQETWHGFFAPVLLLVWGLARIPELLRSAARDWRRH